MILWKTDDIDTEKVRSQVAKAYNIPHPENIQGYGGYFDFCFGEIWIDEAIEKIIKQNPEFETAVDGLLDKFRHGDYGKITTSEKELNDENRYFFGILYNIVGKYQTEYGLVVIKIIDGEHTHITLG